jgi:azurin
MNCSSPDLKAADKAKDEKKPAAAPAKPVVVVNLTGDDRMKFDKAEIKVAAGSKVKLNLTHAGKLPKKAMGHNFVLLKSGTDIPAFANAAAGAAVTNYIPAGQKDSVIANTGVIGGGESTSIEFDAPAAGTYDFICTFPGHYALMKGKFIVQ